MTRSATVITNDPENGEIRLRVSGTVKKFATIKPKRVLFKGFVGEELEQRVTIIPETSEPFKILRVSAMQGAEIRHELKQIEVSGRPAYELKIIFTKDKPGRYYNRLSLITDRSAHGPLTIIVSSHIREKEETVQ